MSYMVNSYLNKPVLSIVATKSGTGKTTLIEKLIPIFKNRGYKYTSFCLCNPSSI